METFGLNRSEREACKMLDTFLYSCFEHKWSMLTHLLSFHNSPVANGTYFGVILPSSVTLTSIFDLSANPVLFNFRIYLESHYFLLPTVTALVSVTIICCLYCNSILKCFYFYPCFLRVLFITQQQN